MPSVKSVIGSFDIIRFVKLCFKSWYVFAVTVLACAFMAIAVVVLKQPKSEVMAQLVLKDDGGGASALMAGQLARSFAFGDMFGGSSSTDNETFVIKSHTVFDQTVRQMGLNIIYAKPRLGVLWSAMYDQYPLRLVVPEGISDTLSVGIGFKVRPNSDNTCDVKVKAKRRTIADIKGAALPVNINTDYGNFVLQKTQYYDPETFEGLRISLLSYGAAASIYEETVNVYVPDRKSDFIDISYVTANADFGKRLLNHIIDNYITLSNDYNNQRSAQSLRLVDERLESLSTDLVDSEKAIEAFKTQNDLTDVSADAQYLMAKTGSLESSVMQARTNFELIGMTRDFLSNPENKFSLIPELSIQSSSTQQRDNASSQISQYNQLILRRMQLLVSAKDNNASLAQLDQQIEAMRDNIITSVNRMYENVKVVLDDLIAESNKNKLRLDEIPAIERQYLILKRDNMLQEQMYLFLLQQREELNMSLASRNLPAQIIDAPYALSESPGLSPKLMIAIAVFLGLLLGAAYVWLFKMKRTPVTSIDEADALISAPLLHPVPLTADPRLITEAGGNSESIRQLRSDVQFALSGCDGKALVVSSLNSGAGKTYISVNLAVALALIGRRVVIVDTDLASPGVAKSLGITSCSVSLYDYVHSDAPVKPQGVKVGDNAVLDVICALSSAVNSSDLVGSERFAALIDRLRGEYDYIVIDSTRIKGHSDIYYLTGLTDMTLVVCRAGLITPDDIECLNTLYNDGRLKRIAVVENGFKA